MGELIRIHPRWEPRLVAAGLDRWSALADRPAAGPAIAESRTSRTDRIEVAGTALHRKRYAYPTRRDRWRAALRGTWLGRPRALREFEALITLAAKEIRVVEPVAYAERRRFGWVHETLLLTVSVPEASAVDPAGPAVTALGRALADAHAKGIELGGLALRDVVVAPGERGPEITFLDLPRAVSRRGPLESPRRESDVSRIVAGLEHAEGAVERLVEGYETTGLIDRAALERELPAARAREERRGGARRGGARREGASGVRD